MSQDYISALFDALFFAVVGLIIVVSWAFSSFGVFVEQGLVAALSDFLPGLLWGGASILFGVVLFWLSRNSRCLNCIKG